jgi:NDP-sugar pyrophosphorylase family protein
VYRSIVEASPGRIRVWPTTAHFLDIGTPADYLATVLQIAKADGTASIVEDDAVVSPSARLTNCVVWPGTRIGANVTLDHCVVAGPVTVPDGARFSRQVLVPASIATAADRCERASGVAAFEIN